MDSPAPVLLKSAETDSLDYDIIEPISRPPSSPDSIKQRESTNAHKKVILNVGGIRLHETFDEETNEIVRRYETLVSTFRNYPDSLLGKMFSEQYMKEGGLTRPDDNGEYFIDRNGHYFEVILDFYRTGEVVIPSTMPEIGIRCEISYFQLPVDERQVLVQGEKWGDRISKIAIGRAMDNDRFIFDKIMEHISTALNSAADFGCCRATIDICKTTAYVRTSGGIAKVDFSRASNSLTSNSGASNSTVNNQSTSNAAPSSSIGSIVTLPGQNNTEENADQHKIQTSAPHWHYNLIDAAIWKWLSNNNNRMLLEAHLVNENLNFTLVRELYFFVFTFRLFEFPQPSVVSSKSLENVSRHIQGQNIQDL